MVASLRPFFEPSSVAVSARRRGAGRSGAASSGTSSPPASRARPIRSIARASPLPACAAYTAVARDSRSGRPGCDLRAGRARSGAAEDALAARRSCALCHLRGVRRGRRGRRRAPGSAARARARARCTADRARTASGSRPPAVRLNATFARQAPRRGSIGFSSQSGALGLALLEAADARGIGLSAFVSIGNKADVSSNDLLERWEDDESTKLIALYLESFGNPRKFARIARACRAHEADARAQERAHVRRREGGAALTPPR